MTMKKWLVFGLLTVFIFSASPVRADVGVGVGVGKIVVDEKLRPGIIYTLPNLPVINTGTDQGDYEVTISYSEGQSELKPKLGWFKYSPQTFTLKPKEIKQVGVVIDLPLKMEPGKYFAYLEAHPVASVTGGGAKVGIAAAARLYFEVEPANYFQGIYYKIVSFGKVYYPWPQRALALVGVVVVLALFKKFFNIQVGIKKPGSKEKSKSDSDE
jgi:hypothetical protein